MIEGLLTVAAKVLDLAFTVAIIVVVLRYMEVIPYA